jgi:hypothetical protein
MPSVSGATATITATTTQKSDALWKSPTLKFMLVKLVTVEKDGAHPQQGSSGLRHYSPKSSCRILASYWNRVRFARPVSTTRSREVAADR